MVMLSSNDLKMNITRILDEEVGLLAGVIVDEIIDALGIDDSQLSRVWAGRFVRLLDQRLPTDIDGRQFLIRRVGDLLIHNQPV
jgi:hypothetical protein